MFFREEQSQEPPAIDSEKYSIKNPFLVVESYRMNICSQLLRKRLINARNHIKCRSQTQGSSA